MALHDVTGTASTAFETLQMPAAGDLASAPVLEACLAQKLANTIARIRARVRGVNASALTVRFGAQLFAEASSASSDWDKLVTNGVTRLRCDYVSVSDAKQIFLPVEHLIPGVGTIVQWGVYVCGGAHAALPEHQFQARLLTSPAPAGSADYTAITVTEIDEWIQAEADVATFNTIRQGGGTVSEAIDPTATYTIEITPPFGTDAEVGGLVFGGFLSISE